MNNEQRIHLIQDDDFRVLVAESKNYSDCLRKIGLCTTGSASRTSLKKRIKELEIDTSHFNKFNYAAKPNQNSKPLSFYLTKDSSITQANLKRRLIREKWLLAI